MTKEYYTNQTKANTIIIEDSKIKAIKNKKITQKSVRVFDEKNKTLALAAGVGDISDAELETEAIDRLSLGMKYGYELERDKQAHFEKSISTITDQAELENFTQRLLSDLSDISKHYVLSGDCTLNKNKKTLKNTMHLDLSRQRTMIQCNLMMKQRGSGNIFDTYTGLEAFDITCQKYNQFLIDTEFMARGFMSDVVSLESGEYRILFQNNELLSKFYRDVLATTYEEKVSLLAGRQGEQIFQPSINLYEIYDSEEDSVFLPFDDEGIIREAVLPIVSLGVLKTILYDKKQAAKFGKMTTGNGFRGYNTHPGVSYRPFIFDGVSTKATDIIANDIVIMPIIISGDDFLPNGNYSKPTQLAFVFSGGKFIGKAPQLTITGNYLDSFNKDFIGVAKNDIMPELMGNTFVFAKGHVTVN